LHNGGVVMGDGRGKVGNEMQDEVKKKSEE
jgi:hypothetical protein